MEENIWYTIYPCSHKIGISNSQDSKPIGYILNDLDYAHKFSRKMYHQYGEVKKTTKFNKLEFDVFKDDQIIASFEFKEHKEKYEEHLKHKEKKDKLY